jgi:hypothetical protein
MKRILLVSVTLAIVLSTAFLVSPFIGMARLRIAIDARDAAELTKRVDFRRVANSLSEQIGTAYLKITGQRQRLDALSPSLAVGIGRSLAVPLLSEIGNPQGMLDFLTGSGVSVLPAGLASFNLGTATAWQLFMATEYGFGNAYVTLPLNADASEQFRVRLQILQWNWKVTAIDLPERVRIDLAKELQKKIGVKSP